MSNKESNDASEIGAMLYGALSSLLLEETTESVAFLKHLVAKLEGGEKLPVEELVDLTVAFFEDLTELGYIEFDDEDDTESFSQEDLVEFEINTIPDVDPKKRLN